MKKPFYNPIFRQAFLLVLVLAVTVLWVSGANQVQAQEPINVNEPIFGSQATQSVPDILQGEDNAMSGDEAISADLVITDPQANVQAVIADATSTTASFSDVIPAAAFTVDSSDRQWFFGFNSGFIYPNGSSFYCGIAPVYLPDGAQVSSFIAYIFDNSASENVDVYLYAKPLGTMTGATTMAYLGTSSEAQNSNIQALVGTTIVEPTINNSAYTYHVGVCLWGTDSNVRFYAAQILYNR